MSTDAASIPMRRAPDLRAAVQDSGVIWLGMFTLGIGFGVLVTSHGFPWWLAPIISASMFAGSVEFVLVGMLAATAPITAIALTTFLINSRHLFYGLSFPLHRVNGRLAKAYSVFALCDEAYTLTASKDASTLRSGRILWMQAGQHFSWALGGFVGSIVGSTLLGNVEGLDFILTALFVVLTLDAYKASPDKLTLALAVGAGVLAYAVAPGSMLLVAMAVFTAALVARHYRNRKGARA